jgi:hypothetical protein
MDRAKIAPTVNVASRLSHYPLGDDLVTERRGMDDDGRDDSVYR